MLSDSPAGYWRLGELTGTTAANAVSGGASGTYQNGVVLGRPGSLLGDPDSSAGFDGGNDKVSMGDPANGSLDFGTQDFTVEAWIRPTANDERAVVTKRPYGTPQPPYWQFTVTDDPNHTGQIRANVFDGTMSLQAYGPPFRVDDGAWHYVVIVFDRDAGITIYVDGASTFKPGAFVGSISSNGEFLLGKAGGYGNYKGDLDEVAVYPAILPVARVNAHYTASGRLGPSGIGVAGNRAFSSLGLFHSWQRASRRAATPAQQRRQSRAKARR